jgi:hypothetical protein
MDCPVCSGDRIVDITSFGDPEPVYLCYVGHRFVSVSFRPAPSLGSTHGPDVPTPEDILRSAGIDPLLIA